MGISYITPELDNFKIGEYNLTLEIVDQAGNIAVDQVTITIVDDEKPSISYHGDYLLLPLSKITIEITDNRPALSAEYGWDRGKLQSLAIDEDIVTLYAPKTDGEHTLFILATDKQGNVNTTELEMIIDGSPPTITPLGTLSTTETTIVTSDEFTVKADISDVNGVERVEVWISGDKDGEAMANTAEEFVYTLDFQPREDGDYKLVFKAFDTLGNEC